MILNAIQQVSYGRNEFSGISGYIFVRINIFLEYPQTEVFMQYAINSMFRNPMWCHKMQLITAVWNQTKNVYFEPSAGYTFSFTSNPIFQFLSLELSYRTAQNEAQSCYKDAKLITVLGSNVRQTSKIRQNLPFEAQKLLWISDLRLESCRPNCDDFRKGSRVRIWSCL